MTSRKIYVLGAYLHWQKDAKHFISSTNHNKIIGKNYSKRGYFGENK